MQLEKPLQPEHPMRYRPRDQRNLPEEIFAQRVRNNPYLGKIYDYSELILPHSNFEQFQRLWQKKQVDKKRIHVEIGCGSGRYLLNLSQRYPQDAFLGFELRYKRLVLAAKKLQKHHKTNVLLVKDKGEYLIDYLPLNGIDLLHVNFPDPWSKKSHRKHRLFFSSKFLESIVPLFRPQGQILLKTDHHEYFRSALEVIESLPHIHLEEHTTDLHQSVYNENNIETEFEQLFKSKANPPIAYAKFRVHPDAA